MDETVSSTADQGDESPAVAPGSDDLSVQSESQSLSLGTTVPTWLVWFIILGVIVAIFQTFAYRPSGFLKLEPGPAPLITIEGHLRPADAGNYIFTTVEAKEVNMQEQLWAMITGKDDELVPSSGAGGSKAASFAQMDESKLLASQVATAYVKDPELSVPTYGAKVLEVKEGSPAAAAGLTLGDTITSLDGKMISNEQELIAAVEAAAPSASLTVLRSGEELSFTVTLNGESLGVQIMTVTDGTPGLVIETGAVGGPSGGLMFTLADIDALTGGDLTGGRIISGTGTISADGSVGPVGGAEHKVITAQEEGAAVFFVPTEDAFDSKDLDIKVVTVNSLDDAVKYLCSTGGKSPVCSFS